MFSKDRIKRVTRKVREDNGIELTPDQTEELLNSTATRIREKMVKLGYDEFTNMTNVEVMDYFRKMLKILK